MVEKWSTQKGFSFLTKQSYLQKKTTYNYTVKVQLGGKGYFVSFLQYSVLWFFQWKKRDLIYVTC